MKTFTKEKHSMPKGRKTRPYAHHPMGPVQLSQQAEIRRILHSTGTQAKLTIGRPNDKYEQEADCVADRVMRMPDPKLQRQPEKGEEEETLQTKPLADQIAPLVQRQEESPEDEEEKPVQAKFKEGEMIQRMCPECEEETAQRQPMKEEDDEELIQTKSLVQPLIQRQTDLEEDREEDLLQTKTAPEHTPQVTTGISNNIQSLKGGGQPLPQNQRTFFESRMGRDFGGVRIHTDNKAADTAQSVQAKAFTLGNNIVFNAGQYSPNNQEGKKLLAHELTHVIQQNGQKAPQIQTAPQPVTKFSETYVPFSRADIEKELKGVGYWETLIATHYDYNRVKPVGTRFTKNPEERDAVLAVLWQSRPKSIKGKLVQTVSVPSRGAKTKPLLYKITYQQKAKGAKKHKVSVQFITEGAKASIITAPTPPANFKPSRDYSGSDGFPESISDYWKKHPREHKQVYFWIDKKAVNKIDQKLATSETYKGRKRRALFRVVGTKIRHNITFMGVTATLISKPAAGYHGKTPIDFLIEQEQQKKGIRLGKILGLNTVPKDEKESVKYTIYQHFTKKSQDVEVNVVVPIAKTSKNAFYTLRFLKKAKAGTVDVEIVRVGEQKAGTKMDVDQLSVRRVHGFDPRWTNINDLKKWLNDRYGSSIKPKGTKITDIIQNADKDLQSKVNTDKWFKDNYNITILNAIDAATRLTDPKIHNYDVRQTVDLKNFAKSDRLALEFALQTMSKPIIDLIKSRSIHIARQKELYKKLIIKKNRRRILKIVKDDSAGITLTTTKRTNTSILIADEGVKDPKGVFLGGGAGVRKRSIGIFAHEFGHVVEKERNIKNKFDAFVSKHGIKPPTAYAGKKPKKEFFTEAFMLYQTNPDWMKRNINILFKWFEKL